MLTPVLRESRFKETGVLTPEEFVAAGDHLCYQCPTWSWSSANDSSKIKDFLPNDKQFLITKRVPCHQRCSQIIYDSSLEMIIKEESKEGEIDEWVDTHHFENQDVKNNSIYDKMDINDKTRDQTLTRETLDPGVAGNETEGEEEEPVDMEAFLASGALEDDDPNRFIEKRDTYEKELDGTELVEQTRTYDLHITYDKYYQVPRFWLIGYDERGNLLSIDQMKEDFSQDHADRTITLESHPHMNGLYMATIHPCRHASVMKRLIERFSDSGKELYVIEYIFVFLKFVQAVIPTVEYDYTRSIQF